MLEIIGGIALVRLIGYFMGNYVPGEGTFWLWLVLGVLAAVLLGAMLATLITVKEPSGRKSERQLTVWNSSGTQF